MEAAHGLMLMEADHGRKPRTTWVKLMAAAHGSKLMEADQQGSDTELFAAAGHCWAGRNGKDAPESATHGNGSREVSCGAAD